MKTTLLTRLLASVVLALGLTAVNAAPIPLDEVKVGSTVTGEGIGIGWGKNLPVPDGEWEVVVRDEMTYFSNNANPEAPSTRIELLNKDNNAPLQIVSFKYLNPRGRMSADISCNSVNGLLNDRLGTVEGQNFQLCKKIFKPLTYNSIFNVMSKDSRMVKSNRTDKDYLIERFGEKNPEMVIARLDGGKLGGFFPAYYFGFNIGTKNLNLENKSIKSIDEWLTLNATKVEAYFNGEQIKFTNFSIK